MSTTPPQANSPDSLAAIFAMQAELNNYVFARNGIERPNGGPVTMADITSALAAGQLGANDLPNIWLSKYAQAMGSELDELRDDLLWKWWSKDQLNIQNIRVELIDILHFLVSAMITAGLTADKVVDLYRQKHAVNLARQDAGYSAATKDEADNRRIQ